MRRVLGIDPGPSKSGYCLLDFTIRSAPIWLEGGWSEDVPALLDVYTDDPSMLVVVEQPRALHNALANVQVIRTAWEGGDAYGYARAKGFTVLKVGVNEWRVALVGNSRRGDNVDHKVEEALRRLLRQMPTRTSSHARDAAGVAVIGARAELSSRYSIDRARSLSSFSERASSVPVKGEPAR